LFAIGFKEALKVRRGFSGALAATLILVLMPHALAGDGYVYPDDINATILGERARSSAARSDAGLDRISRRAIAAGDVTQTGNTSNKCGHVEIGNINTKPRGNAEVNVIVLGDVFNTGNVCR
jgi:hypothetical protein